MSEKKIIYYYQTFESLKPILVKNTVVTHLHVSSVHFGKTTSGKPYIHINDNAPDWEGFATLWEELQQAKSLGIKIVLMVGGAGGAFTDLFSNFEIYYALLKTLIREKNIFDGIDLDVEEITPIENIQMLINRVNKDFGEDFIISMAPVAYSLESDTPGMGGFIYKNLLKSPEGQRINYFNGQFYYNLSEEAYNSVVNNGYPPEKIVFGMESNENIDNVKTIVKNLSNKYSDFGGVFVWEYFNADKENPYNWALTMYDALHANTADLNSKIYQLFSFFYNMM